MNKPEMLFPINFSPSMFSDIWLCELKFYRKYVQRLKGVQYNGHLIAGSNFALGCEVVRKSYYNENLSVEESIEKGKETILTAPVTNQEGKSNSQLAYVLEKYFKRFPLDGNLVPLELIDGTFAVEYEFVFDLGIPHPDIRDTNICFKGRLDLLAGQKVKGRIEKKFIIDEKTTGSVSRISGTKLVDEEKEKNSFILDGQLLAYAYAASKLGVKVDGAKIRKVPILTNHEDAFELDIPISQYKVDNWFYTTINKINELVEKYKYYRDNNVLVQQAFYPVYNTNCTSYQKLCEFAEACLYPQGEQTLMQTHRQIVYSSSDPIGVELSEYKRGLNLC